MHFHGELDRYIMACTFIALGYDHEAAWAMTLYLWR